MKKYEEPQYDDASEMDFSSMEQQYESYRMSSDDDDDDDDKDEEEEEEVPDNDWGDVDPLDTPLRRMPDPMDPSGPGSAV